MLKKITLIFIAFLLMINMYMGVIYAAEKKTKTENTVTEEVVEQPAETPAEPTEPAPEPISKVTEAKAEVIEAGEVRKVANGAFEDTIQTLKLRIISGDYKGKEISTDYVLSYDVEGKILAYELSIGNRVNVQVTEDPDGTLTATVEDFQRTIYIYFMFALLLLAIIVIGGKQGVRMAISLTITMLAFYFVLVKSIFAGTSAIAASIMTSFVVMVMTFAITIGINKKSLTGALGSFAGTLVAGALAILFGNLVKLSGASEEAIQLSLNLKTVAFDFRDLIFATIVASSIGACMDIGVAIVNNLDEIKDKTEDSDWKELFKNGMQVGREVIGTMSNTLILVYVGGLMKLVLLYLACNMEISHIMSKEAFAEQFVAGIAGSIGVVCTVPLTALAYAFINRKKTAYRTVSDNKIEGKRSLKI